jgi:hypothetical protein
MLNMLARWRGYTRIPDEKPKNKLRTRVIKELIVKTCYLGRFIDSDDATAEGLYMLARIAKCDIMPGREYIVGMDRSDISWIRYVLSVRPNRVYLDRGNYISMYNDDLSGVVICRRNAGVMRLQRSADFSWVSVYSRPIPGVTGKGYVVTMV